MTTSRHPRDDGLEQQEEGQPPREQHFEPEWGDRGAIWDEQEYEAINALPHRRADYLQVWWVQGFRGGRQALIMPTLIDPDYVH